MPPIIRSLLLDHSPPFLIANRLLYVSLQSALDYLSP